MGKPIVHRIWSPKDCRRAADGSAWSSEDREDELLSLSLTLGSVGKGCIPAAWACRVLGVTRGAMSRAIARGDVRVVRVTLPGGHEADLVNPEDALFVGSLRGSGARGRLRSAIVAEESRRAAAAAGKGRKGAR